MDFGIQEFQNKKRPVNNPEDIRKIGGFYVPGMGLYPGKFAGEPFNIPIPYGVQNGKNKGRCLFYMVAAFLIIPGEQGSGGSYQDFKLFIIFIQPFGYKTGIYIIGDMVKNSYHG
jgi:hypothetical protein